MSNIFRRICRRSCSLVRMSCDAAGETTRPKHRLIDVGSNLLDDMYGGVYNGSVKHEGDVGVVLDRARAVGVEGVFVTAGSLEEAKKAAQFCREERLSSTCLLRSTVGVHPTRCLEFSADPSGHISSLLDVWRGNKDVIVALGEFGLDADRVEFCPYAAQLEYFELQLRELGPATDLPLFLHCRGAAKDLTRILKANRDCFPKGGVVHSFDGTLEDLESVLELGLHVGVNGCSLKTESSCSVVSRIPLDRLVLETDAPWCSMRPSHFSSKFIKTKFPAAKKSYNAKELFKTRNEPCTLLNVLEVVSGLRGEEESIVAAAVWNNTHTLFRIEQEEK